MNCGNKKIKLDPDIVKTEPQQDEEAEEKDIMYSFEEVLVETRDENIELKPENFFIKEEKEEEMEVGEDIEQIDPNSYGMSDGNLSLNIEDEAESTFTTVKSDKRNIPTKTVRDFMCTTCNYATKKPFDFTRHWLSHEVQSYTIQNGVYVCQISDCFYVAPNKGDLLKHIASRHLYRYRCNFCYYVTYSKKDYVQHRTTHYTYQCLKCDLQSTKHLFVQDHVEAHWKCGMCDFTTHHWFLYKKHINFHKYPPESIVECGCCDFVTGDQALLEKHKVVHCQKIMFCKMCSWTGVDTAELAQHWENTHDTTLEAVDKLHKCKFCTCKFLAPGSKKKHEELHLRKGASLDCCSNSITVECPYCDYQKNHRDDMNLHIASKHAAALELENFRVEKSSDGIILKDLVNIDECEEPEADQRANAEDAAKYASTTTDSDSTGHHKPTNAIKVSEQELKADHPRYICTFCYYVTSSKEDYDGHYKTHTTFKCTKCQFESTKRLFVEDHAENPWGCRNCEFKAHHWLLMKSHSFSHHNQGNPYTTITLFKCHECNFETKRPADLTTHWLIHKSAVLRCKVCSFETRFEHTLQKHYTSRHNMCLAVDGSIPSDERPYECDLCVCKFKEQKYLDKHRALHEKNGPFHLKCFQCHQCKRVSKPGDKNEQEKPDSWRECPYCSFQDEARYRMIQHLNQTHAKQLEIEGYRFDDGQISIEHPAGIPQIQGSQQTPNPDKAEDERKNEDGELGRKTEKDTNVCLKRPGYVLKHKIDEHSQRMFRCNICGYATKGKIIIEKHMDQNHHPQASASTTTDEKMLSCAACCYRAKTRYYIRKHMLNDHATENEEEENASSQIDKEETECKDEAQANNSIDEKDKPIEQVVIKVESTSFTEEESVENVTSEDNTVRNMQENEEQPQIKPEPGLTNDLVPIYRELDNKWCCPECSYSVLRKHFVQQHIDKKHKGCERKTYYCTICPHETKFKDSLMRHVEIYHRTGQRSNVTSEEIPCKQPGCDFKAPTVDELSMHMARHLQSSMQEVMVYKCKLCSFGTVSKTIFKNHSKSCTGVPYWYQCYDCDFKSETRKGILSHIDTKHRYKYTHKKGYECLKCGYSSKEKTWTEYHRVNCHIKGEVEY